MRNIAFSFGTVNTNDFEINVEKIPLSRYDIHRMLRRCLCRKDLMILKTTQESNDGWAQQEIIVAVICILVSVGENKKKNQIRNVLSNSD